MDTQTAGNVIAKAVKAKDARIADAAAIKDALNEIPENGMHFLGNFGAEEAKIDNLQFPHSPSSLRLLLRWTSLLTKDYLIPQRRLPYIHQIQLLRLSSLPTN